MTKKIPKKPSKATYSDKIFLIKSAFTAGFMT